MLKYIPVFIAAFLLAGCSKNSDVTDGASVEDDSQKNAAVAEDTRPENPSQDKAEAEVEAVGREYSQELAAGRREAAAGRPEEALAHFQAIPRDGSAISVQACLETASTQERLGRLKDAVDSYEYVRRYQNDHPKLLAHLASLYALSGQRATCDSYLSRLVKSQDFGFKPLVLLTDFERRHGDDLALLDQLHELSPDDPLVQLGLAVESFNRGDLDAARKLLEKVVASSPEIGKAQALLGEVLLLQSANQELVDWYGNLPDSVQSDPDIWYTKGLWARQLEENAVAVRCFWECLRQCPTSYRANYQLGSIPSGLSDEDRQKFTTRAQQINEVKEYLSRVLSTNGKDEDASKGMIDLLLTQGREWEAWSWCVMLQSRIPTADWLRGILERLEEYPLTRNPRIRARANLTVQVNLEKQPDFESMAEALISRTLASKEESATESFHFAEEAESRGLKFAYHRGRVPGLDGVRMQESTGGGVGVLDYDNDGWPDLFLTQGEDWPIAAAGPTDSQNLTDALFRNYRGRFENHTGIAAMPNEGGFGQGCACGDFNNDGFTDLYVANIGVNQLLLNNGDGTFSDHTPEVIKSRHDWTSSCAMVDLSGDGNPDLFDVNYVNGEHLFQMICDDTDCSPNAYEKSPDYAYVSNGQGDLELLAVNPDGQHGAGLGVVVFRTDKDPLPHDDTVADQTEPPVPPTADNGMALFVANDQDPNAFLKVKRSSEKGSLQLEDLAFQSGISHNRDGMLTACMGIAAGDLTGDGRIDLLVTNYRNEANSLYVQQNSQLFVDSVAGSGLLNPGLPYVGWGTQCIDADNDGHLDLVVANGHVGEFGKQGLQERMPTQVFRNSGADSFQEVAPSELGPFFERDVFGRSVAVLDWDQNGQPDIVVSLLDENVALLRNETRSEGNWLDLRLAGKNNSRDGVGAVITVHAKDKSLRRQLMAGDGFQCSNEKTVHFGLGAETSVDEVEVSWSDGTMQRFAKLPANATYSIVEGRQPLPLP